MKAKDQGKARFIPALAGNIKKWFSTGPRNTVHPRARGEHDCRFLPLPVGGGSSPRSRGTLSSGFTGDTIGRFIPALAGNICCFMRGQCKATVHPRARGEHHLGRGPHIHPGGSSPRSRGTSTVTTAALLVTRFIPALAGNIAGQNVLGHGCPVHPRARGEHFKSHTAVTTPLGSSPRSRGTFAKCRIRRICGRFIPALAGNMIFAEERATAWLVHPRARGEHSELSICREESSGSSPRSRGTSYSHGKNFLAIRFIPALAGNILQRILGQFRLTVHPRARGEHFPLRLVLPWQCGSSPRSRGTFEEGTTEVKPRRFIPALAGNMLINVGSKRPYPVHPRARGEHTRNH